MGNHHTNVSERTYEAPIFHKTPFTIETMASSQSLSFVKAVAFFLLLLSALTFAIPQSDGSDTDELPCISKCPIDSSVPDNTSVCATDIDKCRCAMVNSDPPEAAFTDCVEACSQEEQNELKRICAADKKRGTGSILVRDDDDPVKAPGVKVANGSTGDTTGRNNRTTGPSRKGSSPSLLARHAGWTGIGAAVIAVVLMGLI